jgi:hypothetical protein
VESPTYVKKDDKNGGYSQFYYQNSSNSGGTKGNGGNRDKNYGGYYEKGKGGKGTHQKLYVEKNQKGGYSHY